MTHGIECESGRLQSASWGRFETIHPVTRFYDDGWGPVWIYQDAGGLLGIIRARTFEDAWAICEDEIFDDGHVGKGEIDAAETHDQWELPEGYGWRPSGGGSNAWNQSAIYSEDLNGSSLRLLTATDMDPVEGLGVRLLWAEW